jgi:SprT protein
MRLRDIAQRFYKSAQLLFQFDDVDLEGGLVGSSRCDDRGRRGASTLPELTSPSERPIHLGGRDRALESQAREMLRGLGADKLAREIRVEWNPRLKTCAGRADFREKLISLNPLLRDHGPLHAVNLFAVPKLECNLHSSSANHSGSALQGCDRPEPVCGEVDRTLRHELAHLLAQWRIGRRRIAPHGKEWRQACRDLGIADEARCHNLPFATKTYARPYIYRCPNCKEKFPRVRRIRRAIACLACCRKHSGGDFDPRFRLKLYRGCSIR